MLSVLALCRLNAVKGKSVDPDLRQSGCLLYRPPSSRGITDGMLFITSINIHSSNQLLGDERNDQWSLVKVCSSLGILTMLSGSSSSPWTVHLSLLP